MTTKQFCLFMLLFITAHVGFWGVVVYTSIEVMFT